MNELLINALEEAKKANEALLKAYEIILEASHKTGNRHTYEYYAELYISLAETVDDINNEIGKLKS